MVKFSVIVPAINEEENVQKILSRLNRQGSTVEAIVVDGGSTDQTVHFAQTLGATVTRSAPGRGKQCNVGARLAHGEVLLFLHADTELPETAFSLLERVFQDQWVQVGTFRLIFDWDHWILKLYSKFSRFDSIFTRFGDQCIVVRKSFYQALGGFPDWPLFEDVGFLQTARKSAKIISFPRTVRTSARKYRQNGVIRQQLKNLWLMLHYLAGTHPEKLARKYYADVNRTDWKN